MEKLHIGHSSAILWRRTSFTSPEAAMNKADILKLPSMPASSPSYPRGPYRFVDRDFFIVSYKSDSDAIRAALPEPLEPDGSDTVLYEFINMPDSSGFG